MMGGYSTRAAADAAVAAVAATASLRGGEMVEGYTYNGGSPPPPNKGVWSEDEHERFLAAEKMGHLSDNEVAHFVGTRSRKQVVSHRQKLVKKQKRREKKIKANGQTTVGAPRQLHRLPDSLDDLYVNLCETAAAPKKQLTHHHHPSVHHHNCPSSPNDVGLPFNADLFGTGPMGWIAPMDWIADDGVQQEIDEILAALGGDDTNGGLLDLLLKENDESFHQTFKN